MTAAGRFSFAQANRVLTIDGVEMEDAGMYTCVATQQSNSGPETTQTSAELTITGKRLTSVLLHAASPQFKLGCRVHLNHCV